MNNEPIGLFPTSDYRHCENITVVGKAIPHIERNGLRMIFDEIQTAGEALATQMLFYSLQQFE